MAKRYRNLIGKITAPETMREAYRLTARGKRLTAGYLDFKEFDALNLAELAGAMRDGCYAPGKPNEFYIHDPKRRLISALPFRDRVVQQALDDAEDDVERARHLIVRSYMGFGSNAHSSSPTADRTGFKSFTRPGDNYRSTGFRANSNRSGTTPAHDWANYPDVLPAIVERLRGVIIERRPAIEVMKQHAGGGTLCYVDPPYLPETRSPANKYDLKHRMYRHELTVDDHRDLLEFLKTLEGYVVLSGYPSALYDDALAGWRRASCEALADGARARTEVLWINPACAAALDREREQKNLFDP